MHDAIVQVPVHLISVAVEDIANDLEEVIVMILLGRIVGRRSINVNWFLDALRSGLTRLLRRDPMG
jgi:hypothetical protein